MKFELEEINSGEDDDTLWVMLGFCSEFEPLDTLYIVCPATDTREDTAAYPYGLYYERFDQLYSCCDAASRLIITANTIDLALTPEGAEALNFDGPVTFQCPPGLEGLSEARKVLQRMATHSNVPIICGA